MFVPPPQAQASALSIELANRITGLIQEFKQSHPGTSDTDIHNALRLAETQSGAGARQRVVLAIGLAVLLLGALMAFFMMQTVKGDGGSPQTAVYIVAAVIAIVGIAAVFLARK